MRGALVLILLLAAPAKAPRPPPPPAKKATPSAEARDAGSDAPVAAKLAPAAAGHASSADTRCGTCHVTASWTDVRFNHDRTGFPLTGAHTKASCKGCHPGDFERPVPSTCNGCHTDVHAGDLGARCESCHDTASWASRFEADAHRRTAFPLIGAHGALPCNECHTQAVGRRFARPAVECQACHQADLDRTRGSGVDHAALGFTQSCRTCHQAFRFKPAIFADHDRCYVISGGSHANIACATCHGSLQGVTPVPGACATGRLQCTACHTCTGMPGSELPTDAVHEPPRATIKVPGYACVDRKCYQCHQHKVAP